MGVGLLYNQGYFQQLINGEGVQEAVYTRLDFSRLPISRAEGPNGEPVIVAVDLPDRVIHAMVWKVQVGRVPVYLLDSDIDWNSTDDRRLSSQLYGGDRDMRISQEIILGMGGVAALRALGVEASVFHMNEGHSAFLSLARIRDLVRHSSLGFQAALEAVASSTVFTTHTPVPAGHDAFSFDMMERYFSRYVAAVGITRETFFSLGVGEGQGALFSMSVLALKTSRHCNGVSRLHGEVSRELWRKMWEGFADQEMPITWITNGVHVPTWMAPDLTDAMTKAGGGRLAGAPAGDEALGEGGPSHSRRDLVEGPQRSQAAHGRARPDPHARSPAAPGALQRAHPRGGGRSSTPRPSPSVSPAALPPTSGPLLFFSDLDRVYRLVTNPARPVQILFAGKAHPADDPGKELIRRIHEISQDPRFAKHVVMVEGYDISLARNLVRGVDVWLNNPRRPLEACGTSGQKAGLNGVINWSVLDGWWDEGYNGENGWTIGEPREYADHSEQDRADVLSLYDTLESEIIPLFYSRNEKGIPTGWVDKMRDSIVSVGSEFNTDRMLGDYTRQLYVPACEQGVRLTGEDFREARSLAEWKTRVRSLWHQVHLEARSPQVAEVSVGEQVGVRGQGQAGQPRARRRGDAVVRGSRAAHGQAGPRAGAADAAGWFARGGHSSLPGELPPHPERQLCLRDSRRAQPFRPDQSPGDGARALGPVGHQKAPGRLCRGPSTWLTATWRGRAGRQRPNPRSRRACPSTSAGRDAAASTRASGRCPGDGRSRSGRGSCRSAGRARDAPAQPGD